MIRLRTRDGGFSHVHIHGTIFILILMILVAIAIPPFLKMREKRAVTCLNNLLSLAEGKPPEKPVCPVSDKAYSPEPERVACPSPEKHLESVPSLVRSKEGLWQVRQTLPSSAGKVPEFRGDRLEVVESPGRVAVLVKPGTAARFFFEPLGFLIVFVVTLACLVGFIKALWRKHVIEAIAPLVGIAVAGGLTFLSLGGFAKSHEWILERSGAKVTRVEYFLGKRRSERTISGCLGVVPTVAQGGHKLQLLHPPDEKGNRTTELGSIDKDRLDVADWFNRALVGP